jgi:hypothetical protein
MNEARDKSVAKQIIDTEKVIRVDSEKDKERLIAELAKRLAGGYNNKGGGGMSRKEVQELLDVSQQRAIAILTEIAEEGLLQCKYEFRPSVLTGNKSRVPVYYLAKDLPDGQSTQEGN